MWKKITWHVHYSLQICEAVFRCTVLICKKSLGFNTKCSRAESFEIANMPFVKE